MDKERTFTNGASLGVFANSEKAGGEENKKKARNFILFYFIFLKKRSPPWTSNQKTEKN